MMIESINDPPGDPPTVSGDPKQGLTPLSATEEATGSDAPPSDADGEIVENESPASQAPNPVETKETPRDATRRVLAYWVLGGIFVLLAGAMVGQMATGEDFDNIYSLCTFAVGVVLGYFFAKGGGS
jgi:hypothetical protein